METRAPMGPPEPSGEAAALAEARWTASDLLARRSPELAPDLLRGQAAELAGSAGDHDRLLARFLDQAADDIEQGRPPLETPEPCPPPAAGPPRPQLLWWAGAALLALVAGILFVGT